jgi:hypothetical protein
MVRRFSSLGSLGDLQESAVATVTAALSSIVGGDETLLAYADRPASPAGPDDEVTHYTKESPGHPSAAVTRAPDAPAEYAVDVCLLTASRIIRATVTPNRIRMAQVSADEAVALRVSMNSVGSGMEPIPWDAPSASIALRLPRHLRHKDEADWWVWQPQFTNPEVVWDAVRKWQTRGTTRPGD